jgi:hypothetical protein
LGLGVSRIAGSVSLGMTVYVTGSAARAPGTQPSMAMAITARIVRLRGLRVPLTA